MVVPTFFADNLQQRAFCPRQGWRLLGKLVGSGWCAGTARSHCHAGLPVSALVISVLSWCSFKFFCLNAVPPTFVRRIGHAVL